MTRAGLSSRLGAHIPEPFVSVYPLNSLAKNLADGDLVEISSSQGRAIVRVSIDKSVKHNQLFMPIHSNQITASQGNICSLIEPYLDDVSG